MVPALARRSIRAVLSRSTIGLRSSGVIRVVLSRSTIGLRSSGGVAAVLLPEGASV